MRTVSKWFRAVAGLFTAFMMVIFFTTPLLPKKADADTYTRPFNWPIKGPDPNQPTTKRLYALRLVYGCRSNCPVNQAGEWASDFAFVTCVSEANPVEGGYLYYMRFVADNGDWPTWPSSSTVTCSYGAGGNTYQAVATLSDAPSGFWASQVSIIETGWNPSNGLTLTMNTLNGNNTEVGKPRYVEAPAASYYDGCWAAKRNGGVWAGVRCCADDHSDQSRADVVGAVANELAVEGTGTCEIPRYGTTDFVFDLTIDRP